jgi:hypothetical protein
MSGSLFRQRGGIAGLVAAALLFGTPITAAPGPVALNPLPKGWGWLLAAGILSGVDPNARTTTFAITGQGRLEMFEGGSTWRRQAVTGPQLVHVLPQTVIAGAGAEPVALAAIRSGAPAAVWGVVRPDASVLALKVLMTPAVPRSSPAQSIAAPSGVSGTVLRPGSRVLEVLTVQGARRSIIVTGATVVHNASGATEPVTSVEPYDIVRIEGTINSDGSVAATRIDVEMEAAVASQVSGSVDLVIGEVEGFVVGGVMVPTSPGCYFVQRSGPGSFKQLAPGQPVTVYGTPIFAGSTPIGLRARVVVGR